MVDFIKIPAKFLTRTRYSAHEMCTFVSKYLSRKLGKKVVCIGNAPFGSLKDSKKILARFATKGVTALENLIYINGQTGKLSEAGTGNVHSLELGSIRGEPTGITIYAYSIMIGFEDSDQNWFAFEEDLPRITAMVKQPEKLPYSIEAFPVSARSWLDTAVSFFSKESTERLRKMHVPQQLGMIISGPPGCGKTMFMSYIADKIGMEIDFHSPVELMHLVNNGGELGSWGIHVFDDVEELLQEREGADSTTVLSWLLTETDPSSVDVSRMLIMVTNHPEKLDSALRRPGRFDVSIEFEPPTEEQLFNGLRVHLAEEFPDVKLREIAAVIANYEHPTMAHCSQLVRLYCSGYTIDESLVAIEEYGSYNEVAKSNAKPASKVKTIGFGGATAAKTRRKDD